MIALSFDGHQARVQSCAMPQLREGDALVRVQLAGICNTDLELVRGYMGFRGILGHEFVGVVEQGPSALLGRRVVGEINFACHHCDWCSRGLQRHCPTRRVMGILDADGALAEYVAVPAVNLHPVADDISDREAVFAEPLAAAARILAQIEVTSGQRCIVFGDGKLGLLVAQVLSAAGADVTAVGKHASHLAMLAARGIRTSLLADWQGSTAPLVVDATGTASGFAMAVAATEPCGTLLLKSTVAAESQLHLAPLVIHEIRVVGSRCGSFPPALDALYSHRIAVEPLIAATFPLRDAEQALRAAAAPGTLKVLVDCDGR